MFIFVGCGGIGIELGINDLLVCDVLLVLDLMGMMCVEKLFIDCDLFIVLNEINDVCVIGVDFIFEDLVFFFGDDQVVLYYNCVGVGVMNSFGDSVYEGWKFYIWNNDVCDVYVDGDIDWVNGCVILGIDLNYGVYWVLEFKFGVVGMFGVCYNFIIYKGIDDVGKEMGGLDFKGKFDQDDEKFICMNFMLFGVFIVFEFFLLLFGLQLVKIEGVFVYWLDMQVIFWDVFDGVEIVKFYYFVVVDLEILVEDGFNGMVIEFILMLLIDEQIVIVLYLVLIVVYEGDWSVDDVKVVFKIQVVVVGYVSDGMLLVVMCLQYVNVFDQLYI